MNPPNKANYMYTRGILSFHEMLSVVDRCTSNNAFGGGIVSVVKIRDELAYNWALDELQVNRVIFDMRDARLLT